MEPASCETREERRLAAGRRAEQRHRGRDTTPGTRCSRRRECGVLARILPSAPAAEIAALLGLGLDNDSVRGAGTGNHWTLTHVFAKSVATEKRGRLSRCSP